MASTKTAAKPAGKFVFSAKDFVHLHTHTHYSVLDGLQKVPDLLDRIKELGMNSVALTDHGTMSGAIEFYKGCLERDIKPIIGLETYVANRKHTDKDPQKDRSRYHLTLLAMNNQGYKNLMRLSTIANLQGFYHKPRVDHDLLVTYGDGLIVLSGCIGGELGEHLRNDNPKKAEEIAVWYKQQFGDRYYIEVQDHNWDVQRLVNDKLISLAKKLDIPVVVTSDAHYCRQEDQEAHEILLCVQTGAFLSDPGRFSLKETKLFVSDPEDIIERWKKVLPEAISNTKKVADRCEVKLELGGILIPKYEVPRDETARSYLEKLSYQGLVERYCPDKKILGRLSIPKAKKLLSKKIVERAEFELGVMDKMNFNDYFLIFWDFVKWGKDHKIVFGPGRGSAAGSILSYALGITELDPLQYDLLFERFLNPDRISMPDIDIDIQHDRRDEVIQYVSEKYGSERVANIVTFGKMFARNAVRDVARVLQVPYVDADRLAKLIPPPVQGRHIPLSKSIKENVELKEIYDADPTAKQVIDLAVLLEGTIRSHGVHAAGVVVAPEDIVNYAPLEMAQKGVVATQYSMYPIMDDIGLLKMDFLGLSNLTIIKNALRIVRKVYGKEIDITKIPLNDKKTYELLAKGETTGVFQLESAGMKRYLKELKPTVFDDIIAMVALYRPGPMQWIDDFIARKNGHKEIEYMHEAMKPALKNTYGVIVYQEQVMQISKDMCGFTGGQADTLRKAIGKKSPEILAKMKVDFIEGGVKTVGATPEMMGIFWRQLEDFAAYCFNKSHAACYGLIAYQTAYIKAHYPAALMAALMTDDYDDTDRLTIDITECKRIGVEVLPPDVNQSFHEFGVIKGKNKTSIRFGLDAIKNVGRGAVEEILVARGDQPFTDLNNFAERVSVRAVNKKNWESLIKAGAMDCFGSRSALLNSLESILLVANRRQKDIASAQADLFGETETSGMSTMPKLVLTEPEEGANKHEFLLWERELLGLYLSEHPLRDYELILSEKSVPIQSIKSEHDGKMAEIGGTISAIRQIVTKNGQVMAFVKLEDMSGEMELVVFPSLFKESPEGLWQRDNVILAKGRVSGVDKNGVTMSEAKILVESATILSRDEALSYQPKGTTAEIRAGKQKYNKKPNPGIDEQVSTPKIAKLFVRIEDTGEEKKLVALKRLLESKTGSTDVVLVMG
ncbi:MAG: DNA polymerase III subunit alpha, partial [Patescibacteria group bacterium]